MATTTNTISLDGAVNDLYHKLMAIVKSQDYKQFAGHVYKRYDFPTEPRVRWRQVFTIREFVKTHTAGKEPETSKVTQMLRKSVSSGFPDHFLLVGHLYDFGLLIYSQDRIYRPGQDVFPENVYVDNIDEQVYEEMDKLQFRNQPTPLFDEFIATLRSNNTNSSSQQQQ